MAAFHTKKQACHPTEIDPGDVCKGANVLHVCKIQDHWHKAEENKVGASNNAQEERGLSELGTAQDHFEENLSIRRQQECHAARC